MCQGNEIDLKKALKFTVLICTYESIMSDVSALSKINWKFCVVDEAHRLKNKNSKLFQSLKSFKTEHRVLLTGTPIQNNIEELWTLLSFIAPTQFPSLAPFAAEYGDMKDAAQVDKLHAQLRPYLLRRMKEDVAKNIPSKEETMIEVELTMLQKQYYRAVLEKNRGFLSVQPLFVCIRLRAVCLVDEVCSCHGLALVRQVQGLQEEQCAQVNQYCDAVA